MAGETFQFTVGDQSFSGYLSQSEQGSGPGVIVIQEWWGLVGHIREVVEDFAAEGFTALAPDFYHGEKTTEPDEAGSMMMALNIGEAEEMIRGAIDALSNHQAVKGEKFGVVGFCMGGQLSMYAACLDNRIGACVNYYGVHPNVHPEFEKLEAPMLGFFAENDEYASPEVVAELSAKLSALGKVHDFETFVGREHAFFNSHRRTVHDPVASKKSWEKMLGFFREHLG